MSKLAILVPTLSIGGGERVAIDLYNYLTLKHEHVDLLVAFDFNKKSYALNYVPLADFKNLFFINYLIVWFKLKKLLRVNKYEVLITVMPHMNLLGALVKNKKLKLIVTEHNIQDPTEKKYRIFLFNVLKKLLYKKANYIIGVSKGVTEYLNGLLNNDKNNIITIPNYINSNYISPTISGQEKTIIFIGRLTYQKGVDVAIKIFHESGLINYGYTLKIYGDGELLDDLVKHVRDLGLSSYVFFMGADPDARRKITRSRALLFTSRWEGYGLVLGEAILSKIPVVGYACKSGPDDIARLLNLKGMYPPNVDTSILAKKLSDFVINKPSDEILSLYKNKFMNYCSSENTLEKYNNLL